MERYLVFFEVKATILNNCEKLRYINFLDFFDLVVMAPGFVIVFRKIFHTALRKLLCINFLIPRKEVGGLICIMIF